ncbi:MAG TPA: ATP-binding protein [Polyangiaceae bacterium]
MSRLTPLAAVVGLGIQGMTLAALWDRPRAMAVSLVAFVTMLALNVYLNMVVLERRGPRTTELFRLVVSVTTSVLTNHYTGWPLPTWLWLPYHGLTTDGHRKWNWIALVSFVVALDLCAIHDHQRLVRPLLFTFLAIAARVFTDARVAIVRRMLEESEVHRQALDAANAKLHAEIVAREEMESRLRQAQKLEAVGRLASGVAHEINTPVQFVNDSVSFLSDALTGFARVIEAHRAGRPDVARVEAEEDLPFLMTEAPRAVELTKVGLERITAIVRSMRQIAHADGQKMEPLDVTQAVTTAVTIAMSECKLVADVETRLEASRLLVCHGGEIVQVLLNLIVNAAHAIRDTHERGRIVVSTAQHGERLRIDVSDTGLGIPESVQERIFEPFFTTKKIGQGTGQGLAIARGIITRHGGTLTFTTGHAGTTFHIELPFEPAKLNAAA